GDPELGLGEDEVAIAHWERVGMPPERIVRLPRANNFWSVGGPGPCGPDSEIFFDWGEDVGCRRPECAPGCECERFLEFWNLVFMEFELHADGSLTPLPEQNIDTGMGLERAARILQQVPSVYDTDGYQEIMRWIAERSGVAYGEGISGEDAFRLHDTYGFPVELTEELARERGLPVDVDGFRRLMEEQRQRSRRAAASDVDVRVTADVKNEFVGYERTEVLTAILAYEDLGDGRFQAKLERSPFYPEGGGQVSDSGFIENEETGARAELVAATRLPDDD